MKDGDFRLVTINLSGLRPYEFAVHSGVDEFVSSDIRRTGVWEPFETMVFSRLCKRGDIVMDLGANIGWYSVLAAQILESTGQVLAFEPDETNMKLLKLNVARVDKYSIIQIFPMAVGDRDSETLLFRSSSNLGDHRLFSDGSPREAFSVPMTRLDRFLIGRQERLPDVLKSDTQGSEGKIIKGAKDLLAQGWRPLMLLEFWPFGLTQSGDDPLELWRSLIGLGYKVFEVSEGNPNLVPATLERMTARLADDISPNSQRFINVLCIPATSARINFVEDLIV
jgi:FkbM family methyltransferase